MLELLVPRYELRSKIAEETTRPRYPLAVKSRGSGMALLKGGNGKSKSSDGHDTRGLRKQFWQGRVKYLDQVVVEIGQQTSGWPKIEP